MHTKSYLTKNIDLVKRFTVETQLIGYLHEFPCIKALRWLKPNKFISSCVFYKLLRSGLYELFVLVPNIRCNLAHLVCNFSVNL